jgi:hypothetical protein
MGDVDVCGGGAAAAPNGLGDPLRIPEVGAWVVR